MLNKPQLILIVETWLYTEGISGETESDIPVLANKTIKGRIYRNGIMYKPTDNEAPGNKEYYFISVLGKFRFALAFDGNETLDIPYE